MGNFKQARNPTASTTTSGDQYKVARAHVEHENTLIGQRITWYLTFQGFLFTAFFVAIGLFDGAKKFSSIERQHLAAGVYVLGLLGLASSVICYKLIQAAYSQIAVVEDWWASLHHPKGSFPPLTGMGGFKIGDYHVTAAHFLVALGLVWIALMGIFFHAARCSPLS